MSLIYRKRCDQCRRERETGDPELAFWYSLYRADPRQFDLVGNSDSYDFCSLPCLSAWVATRELEMAR